MMNLWLNQSLCYHAHQLNIGQLKFHRIFVGILLKSKSNQLQKQSVSNGTEAWAQYCIGMQGIDIAQNLLIDFQPHAQLHIDELFLLPLSKSR